MYLAPLNYDRYFKKVFSDLAITKKFLEDFLDIEIQDIQSLKLRKSITDDAHYVEFDFRCKIDDQYVIIDMQQWYKSDIVYRFYTYHTMNTVVQLDKLPTKQMFINGKFKEIKDYRNIEPVITLIWMVDDQLGFTQDYVSFIMLPEQAKLFFEETDIWKSKDIKERIQEILKMCNNDKKGLTFLQKNKLIFAFQKNIAKNEKFAKYKPWFDFAEKTLSKDNKKEEFKAYMKDTVFQSIMRRLLKTGLPDGDLDYIKDYSEKRKGLHAYNEGIKEEGIKEGIKQEQTRSNKIIEKAEQEKQKAELKSKVLLYYYVEKKSIEEIASITKESENTIKKMMKMNE